MLCAAALAFLLLPAKSGETGAEIVRKAAIASREGERGAWRLTGTAKMRGSAGSFRIDFDSDLRYRVVESGPIPETDGFDGRDCWTLGRSGIPHRVIGFGRDFSQLNVWITSGQWADAHSGIDVAADRSAKGKLALTVRFRAGVVTARLTLDPKTYLPDALSAWSGSGGDTWTFSKYKMLAGRRFPTHIVYRSGAEVDVYDIARAERVGKPVGYAMPATMPRLAPPNAPVSADVPVKRVGPYLFVHPLLDGQDVGWFFLDTGADAMCIAPETEKKLHLRVVGHETTAGVVGFSQTDVCQAESLKLGPVVFTKPIFTVLPVLENLSKAFKLPIAGICGYDFIARSVVEIDPSLPTVKISLPGRAPQVEGVTWTRIGFASETPMARFSFARFGEAEKPITGEFAIDTGSGSTVDFFTPAVERWRLEDGQKLQEARTGGSGGTAANKVGQLAWFEIAGQRIADPTVGFQHVHAGVFANPYVAGNVGGGFLSKFKLILDYPNERIGFVPMQKNVP
ncbi:MAG TPA: retropepsin-like aspartic protease [Fimbriimonadaceae bacterium]|nr:retropepsin-like aspartic protease [Fimbriimonadaceae bacterium]